MERYETARIDVTQIEEDVIAASVERCEYTVICNITQDGRWTIYYSDGTIEEEAAGEPQKPDVCP